MTRPRALGAVAWQLEGTNVDVHAKVKQIRELVETARAVPMSGSCIFNRPELLRHLGELSTMLHTALDESDGLLDDWDTVVTRGRVEAERIVAQAQVEQERLVSDSEVLLNGQRACEELLSAAREEAATLRREIDDYVDERLATLELSLHKTLDAVARGRRHLQGHSALGELRSTPAAPLPDPFAD